MIIKSRKKVLFNIESIEEFEKYLSKEIKNFKNLNNLEKGQRENLIVALSEKNEIGIKKFRNIFVKNYINCKTLFNKKYWLERGYSHEEAVSEIFKIQKINNIKAVEVMQDLKKYDLNNYKKKRNIYVEYWIEKGFTIEEAKIKLKERQSTFSLEKLKLKYGEKEGLIKFSQRNDKWQNSLCSKMTFEQKNEFEKSKCITKDKMVSKYGEKLATEKWENYIKTHSNMWNASGISKKYIDEILSIIGPDEIETETIFYGSDIKSEFYLYDKETMSLYWYDLTFFDRKKIIEFDGIHVHPDPNALENERLNWKQAYTNKSYEEALSKDIAKEQFAIKNGFEVLRIRLPKHSTNTIKESIDKCIKFIKK